MNLDVILAGMLDHRSKGIQGGTASFPLGDIGRKGWNVLREDLNMPLAVLKAPALAHNGAWMRDFLSRSSLTVS